MGKKRVDVVEEVSVSVGDTARREDKHSLLGSFRGGGAGGGRVFMAISFGEGFIDSSHLWGTVEVSRLVGFGLWSIVSFFDNNLSSMLRTAIGLTRVEKRPE